MERTAKGFISKHIRYISIQDLKEVIQDESIEALGDYNTQHAKARNNLLKIANGQIANYILDRI